MYLSYKEPARDDEMLALADKLMHVLLDSGTTYEKGDEALTAAQEVLLKTTRPVTV
ncbi:hypothetical protein [Oscillibacter sp.]|uniref:hypothetical protein n=1 Tax=Oscillibacter sp. TaxID=1945593 RepID=UPI00289AE23D|nr:hypothetical protein [Oscillibacter sp.]